MNSKKFILGCVTAALVSACSSTDELGSASDIPSWILNPHVEGGIAATDCVKFSGNISVDKKMATANSRLALAQQIDLKVEALDKTYSNRVDANDDTTVGTTFSSVSKQVTQQKLTGSRVVKADVVKILDKDHFCVLTTIEPEETKDLFDALIKQSKVSINAQDEKFLYQEFKAYKAEQDLDKEISKLTN